jgi:hypothetical protein
MTTYSQVRENADSVTFEVMERLAQTFPDSLPIVEIYDEMIMLYPDERAVRTGIWDCINAETVALVGGNALQLVNKN